MHGMIYGAQQTIKLIRLCVFPKEGPAGGCSGPSPAPSLRATTPLQFPPSESPGRSLRVFLSHCAHLSWRSSLLQMTRGTVLCSVVPNAALCPDNGRTTAERRTMLLCRWHFGSEPLPAVSFSLCPKLSTCIARAASARSPARTSITSPAVWCDILHRAQIRVWRLWRTWTTQSLPFSTNSIKAKTLISSELLFMRK